MRMGKGKGSFDHWAARVAVNQIVFEIRGMLHEKVIRDAFRLAGNKLPGILLPPPFFFSKIPHSPILIPQCLALG